MNDREQAEHDAALDACRMERCDCCGEECSSVDEYTGCPGRVCATCYDDWCDGQRENTQW